MDINEMIAEVMRQKLFLFAKWLNDTYNGDISSLDFEKQIVIFEKWYAVEQAKKAMQKITDRDY